MKHWRSWSVRVRHRGMIVVIALAVSVMLTACAGSADTAVAHVAPTVAPEFLLVEPTPRPKTDTATVVILTPTATKPAVTATPQPVIYEIPVYRGTDTLSPGWSLTHSWAITYTLADQGRSISGTHAIAMKAEKDYGALLFANTADGGRVYSRTQVIGVRMWLNGGDQTIIPSDLVLTILGSNVYTYYVVGDASVPTTTKMFFSESRLDELGLPRAIPPNTWVEIDINFDALIYDPDYKYVTAFYIKTDIGFRQTVYIDNISMVLVKDQ